MTGEDIFDFDDIFCEAIAEANPHYEDEGYGPTEAWGVVSNHVDWQFHCDPVVVRAPVPPPETYAWTLDIDEDSPRRRRGGPPDVTVLTLTRESIVREGDNYVATYTAEK